MDDALAAPREEVADESPHDVEDSVQCTFTLDDGSLCGAMFSGRTAKTALNAHSMSRHGVTTAGKPVNRAQNRGKVAGPGRRRGGRRPTADRQAARVAVPPPAADRAKTYHSTLVMYAIVLNLALGRWFTEADKDVVVAGSPQLAAALEAVGDDNESFRTVCDIVLAGGGGNAYVQLAMAVAMIGVPILSNHGVLPSGTGQRFGNMLGVTVESPSASPPPESPSPPDLAGTPPHLPADPADWDMADWQQAMVRMDGNVAVDLATSMMGPNPDQSTIPVGVPAMVIPEEGSRGSVGRNDAGSGDRDGAVDPAGETDRSADRLGDVAH